MEHISQSFDRKCAEIYISIEFSINLCLWVRLRWVNELTLSRCSFTSIRFDLIVTLEQSNLFKWFRYCTVYYWTMWQKRFSFIQNMQKWSVSLESVKKLSNCYITDTMGTRQKCIQGQPNWSQMFVNGRKTGNFLLRCPFIPTS